LRTITEGKNSPQELRYCGVVGQHSGREDPHTSVDSQVSKQGEQSRAHPPSLPGILDQDGYLGLVVRGASPVVPGHRDDRPVADGHQGLSPKVIHLGQPLQRCRPRPPDCGEEPVVRRLRRTPLQQVSEARGVVRGDGPNGQRRNARWRGQRVCGHATTVANACYELANCR
jgi:hypothetical protein